jgi:HK97 family phage major capsid protein
MHKVQVAAAEIAGNWFKGLSGDPIARAWCVSRSIGLAKAAAEMPDSAGGWLVPELVSSEILRILELVGAFRRGAQVRTVTSDAMVTPRRVNGVVANFVAEGASIPESSFLLDGVEVSLKKAGMLVRSSTELFADSAADVGAFLILEFAYALAALEDNCGFNGDGTSSGLGTRLAGTKGAVAAASGHNTFSAIDSTDIAGVIGGVMGAALQNSAWYCSSLAFALTFCRLAGASGGLVNRQMPDGTTQAEYLGWPVRISSQLPNVATSLANLPMLYFGSLAMSSLLA